MLKVVLALGTFLPAILASPVNLGLKVIGGSDAADGQFPYMISLRMNGSQFCGGSILNENWVLTAAHCVYWTPKEFFTVIAGTNLLEEGGATYSLAEVVNHPDWDYMTAINDIALLRLSSPIQFNEKVASIELETEEIHGGEDAVLSGWGCTAFGGPSPNELQYINLNTMTLESCQAAYDGLGLPVIETNICTQTIAGEGSCNRDSGGPLASNGKQIGIVSWGMEGKPSVFTKVSSYTSWISSYIH